MKPRVIAVREKQRGVVLIMLMLLIALIVTVGLLNITDPEPKKKRLQQRTQDGLVQAKDALIAYAVTRYDQDPGTFARLPCPDSNPLINPEGEQDPTCGANNANAVGRLPWRTLNIGPLRDESGECLWYAVSGHYKTNPNFPLANEDSPGLLLQFAADGITPVVPDTPEDRLVAAVISPGPAMPWQIRNNNPATECGGNYNAADFLESVGNAANAGFSDTPYGLDGIAQGDEISKSDPNIDNRINDRMITITRQDIWNAIQNRQFPNIAAGGYSTYDATDIFTELTRELAECMAEYGNSHGENDFRLPWAVPVNLVSDDVGAALPNGNLYSNPFNYRDDRGTFGGRFPYDIDTTMTDAGYVSTIQVPPFSLTAPRKLFFEARCSTFVDLDLLNPPDPAPPIYGPPSSLYQNLWNHWKDHVFYAVSAAFAPNAPGPAPPPAPPVTCALVPPNQPGRDCLSVNGAGDYVAIVMFAGSPLAGQLRNAPPDNDDKANAFNYIDDFNGAHVNGNAAVLDAEDGSSDYQNLPGPNFNDILYCIRLDVPVLPAPPSLVVAPCPD